MLNMCYNQSNPLWSQSLESRAHMTVKKSLQKGGEFHLYPIINRDITTKLPEYSIHVNSAPVQLFLDCDLDHLLRLFNLSLFLYWSLTICRASPSSILKYKKLPIFIHFVPTETTIPHVQLPIWKQNKTLVSWALSWYYTVVILLVIYKTQGKQWLKQELSLLQLPHLKRGMIFVMSLSGGCEN